MVRIGDLPGREWIPLASRTETEWNEPFVHVRPLVDDGSAVGGSALTTGTSVEVGVLGTCRSMDCVGGVCVCMYMCVYMCMCLYMHVCVLHRCYHGATPCMYDTMLYIMLHQYAMQCCTTTTAPQTLYIYGTDMT